MPAVASTSDRLHYELVCILFLQTHRETAPRFCSFRLSIVSHNQDQFPFLRVVFYSQLKSKVGNIITKTTVSDTLIYF